jgi:MSHA biogenesis protein MshQ
LDVSVAGNTGATTATGAIAGVAGSNLATTVRGVLWQSADDLDNDGLPDGGANLSDNATTPGYDWATTLFAATPITPLGGVLGILSGTTSIGTGLFNDDADKGTETVNVAYSEVGSFTLNAAAADFLGTSGVAVGGTGVIVGRLTPHHLTTTVTNSCGSFTYSGQPFLVKVEAHREGGGLTRNYSTTGFAKDVNIGSDAAASCGPALGGFSNMLLPATAFADFDGFADTPPVGNIAAPLPISYAQSLVAPATIAICAKDTDGVNSHGQAPASLVVRNGRLKMSNAFGSEKSDLSLPVQAQYWSGSSWLLASDDACTGAVLGAATSAVALSGYVAPLNSTNLGPAHVTAIASAGGGKWNLVLAKPAPAATGSVNLALNLGSSNADLSCLFKPPATPPATTGANLPWFRGQYGSAYPDGTACPNTGRDPAARGTFGVYAPETKKSIHVRELY